MDKNQAQLASLLADTADDIGNLNAQLPVAWAVSVDAFVEECTELIDGVDPRAHTDPQQRSIRLPKTGISVTPFQLLEAWRMLNQRENTGLRGGLQASAAGVGKSFIVVTAAVLRARIFEVERQVKLFWNSPRRGPQNGPRAMPHLAALAVGTGLKCPSQKKGDIVCYCVPTSKARSFVDSGVAPRGVALIQAPVPVLGQWISIFESCVLDTSAYNLCIVHSDVPPRLKRDFGRITTALSEPAARSLSAAPETYIFLSSHGNTRLLETFTNTSGISVGIMFSDESHFAMRLESRSIAIAREQAQFGDGLDLWLVSATPIRILEDCELPIGIMANSTDLSRTAAVAAMVASRATARSSDESWVTFWTGFAKVFDEFLVRRNPTTSLFCGRPITDLQVVKPNTVWFQTPQQFFDDVEEIAYWARGSIRSQAHAAALEGEDFSPEYASTIDAGLHFVSLFPGAASLIRRGILEIGEEQVREIIDKIKENRLRVERVAQFNQHLEEVVCGSPKLDFIVKEIERMQRDKDERAPGPKLQNFLHEEDLVMKKMVIVTPTLGTAVFLYLYLLKHMPSLAPVLLHNQARPDHREAALNSFQSLTARKNAKHSYVLITPFASGGTGLNLHSANYQILTSPLSTHDSEIQAFARTNRTGQRLALHHSILITADAPADLINLVKYADHEIKNDPFEMKLRLVLKEVSGFKAIQRLEDWCYDLQMVEDRDRPRETGLAEFPLMNPGEYKVYRIRVPSTPPSDDTVVELICFNEGTVYGQLLACTQAWTGLDTRCRHEKLRLRDILLSIWVLVLKREARDLRRILYYNVIQPDLNYTLRPWVYRLMGKELNTELLIREDSSSPQEMEAFVALSSNAPFCIGAQKMLEEYREFQGVRIHSYEFLPMRGEDGTYPGPPFFCFRINFL